MNNFYLDTSAFNYLLDHLPAGIGTSLPEGTAVVTGAFVIAELGATPDTDRRTRLLLLAKAMLDGIRPLAMPGELLVRALECVRERRATMDHSIDSKWDGVWIALNNPERVTEDFRQETLGWKNQQETWYTEMSRRVRPNVQAQVEREMAAVSQTDLGRFSVVTRNLSRSVCELVASDLAKASGTTTDVEGDLVASLVTHSEHWRFFLLSLLYAMHSRALRPTSYSPSRTPGWIDGQQTIYLAACDTFVTEDKEQHRMVRLIAPFGHDARHVWTAHRFEQWLRENRE